MSIVHQRFGRPMLFACVLTSAFAFGHPGPAEQTPNPAQEKTPSDLPTFTVKGEPFSIKVTLKGIFEAEGMSEVVLRPETWTQLSVLEAVDHGTAVKKGDRLVKLDTEKIDRAIGDLEVSLRLSELSLKGAEEELRLLENSLPLDLADAKQSMERADRELLRFLKEGRERAVKSADFSLRNSEHYLEYEMEELRQLEKMYKADDLTEETEEIVLKRQRHAVERMKFSLEGARISHERSLQIEIPEQEEALKEAARRQTLSWKKAQETLPLAVKQKSLEFEKQKTGRARSEENLKKMRKDRAAMEVKAPADGIVYYGQCVNGNWQGQATAAAKLKLGGSLQAGDVFMTIVRPRPLFIRAVVPEGELHQIQPGLKGRAVPAGYPEFKLPAAVRSVAAVPSTGGFDSRISVELGDDAKNVMPGMTCNLEFIPYHKENALTIPAGALITEEDGLKEATYVYLVQDEKEEKRAVKAGKKSGEKVEILEGLKEGDRILLKKPGN